jgi:hypothetical protein
MLDINLSLHCDAECNSEVTIKIGGANASGGPTGHDFMKMMRSYAADHGWLTTPAEHGGAFDFCCEKCKDAGPAPEEAEDDAEDGS